MSHDQVAELGGYQAELAGAVARKDAAHAKAVREQIKLRFGSADQINARADAYDAGGRPVAASQARALAAAMADEEPAQRGDRSTADQVDEAAANSTGPASDAQPPAFENAADATPKESAVTRRGTKTKE